MSRIIIFDADGVAVAPREQFFSQRLSEDYGISPDLVMSLFKNEFYKCVVGEMDLKEVLKSYVLKWIWKGSVDELLQYWWEGENKMNMPVIEIVEKLRARGVKCYLASDQEKYRAGYLMETVGLSKYFDGHFFSCDLGVSKSKIEFWHKVLSKLGNPNPAEIQFWDDEKENIDAPREAGIDARLFTNMEDLKNLN